MFIPVQRTARIRLSCILNKTVKPVACMHTLVQHSVNTKKYRCITDCSDYNVLFLCVDNKRQYLLCIRRPPRVSTNKYKSIVRNTKRFPNSNVRLNRKSANRTDRGFGKRNSLNLAAVCFIDGGRKRSCFPVSIILQYNKKYCFHIHLLL